ncbi:hypothetical protein M422DRAFT_160609 [Sphaerobolus stellatus SS14]|nr:hypothetical protein M422DRAFT_160609 [Sphaerobolus stellatus SS14]
MTLRVCRLYAVVVIISILDVYVKAAELCRSLPSDPTWPSNSTWSAFNASVDGRLIRTVPIGSPCHNPTFNAEKCEYIRDHWRETALHLSSSSSVMAPFFANRSCDPFTAPDDQCVIGSYVQYSVNVSVPAHVSNTLAFAKKHNIRFVVRNTGHDYLGRSTGTGGLAVWLHYVQDIEWIDRFVSTSYDGPAIKAYAGVSVEQIYKAAAAKNHVVVGGCCRSVGFTGGYIQAGGHSLLTSLLGLAADSALEYEVITTQGSLVIASPTENEDLYWALTGGGGGTYGVVWSVTVIAHPNFPVTVANISFTSDDISQEAYWDALRSFQANAPNFTDQGIAITSFYSASLFRIGPLVAPKLSGSQVEAILEPFLTRLRMLGITYTEFSITSYSNFMDAYDNTGFDEIQVANFQLGGWILPRSLFESTSTSFDRMIQVLRNITDQGGSIYDIVMRPPSELPHSVPKAILPAWRSSQKFLVTLLPWNDTATEEQIFNDRKKITFDLDAPLRDLAPESGTYLNEADSDEPNWQNAFYGSNYPKLLEIKDKWDADELLYGATAVGGDRWAEDQDGRLCKVNSYLSSEPDPQKIMQRVHVEL